MVYSTRRFVLNPYLVRFCFLCFSVLLALQLPRLGKSELIVVLSYVCSICACLVCFLFLLVFTKGCCLWLWHCLDFSLTVFFFFFFFFFYADNKDCDQTVWILLRKQAYSNILKILLSKIENFQTKILIFFIFLLKNIDCGYSLEPPLRGGSNEYPQSMVLSRNK